MGYHFCDWSSRVDKMGRMVQMVTGRPLLEHLVWGAIVAAFIIFIVARAKKEKWQFIEANGDRGNRLQ